MPTIVTASDGSIFHLYQLPDLSSPEPEESIEFTELKNDLSDGFRSQLLFGSENGVRSWSLKFPSLAHSSVLPNTLEGPEGVSFSREEYLWELYSYGKITGKPFAYPSIRTGQYYLVDFVNKQLSYQRMKIKLYSTGVELKQVRIKGKTIFDLSKIAAIEKFDETGHGASTWTRDSDSTINTGYSPWTKTGDVVFSANPQNGLNTVRFNGSADTGYINTAGGSFGLYDIFIVMKMREATFSNNAGILTASPGDEEWLTGESGTTRFESASVNSEYRLNGKFYASTDRQAPMNKWGVVHFRINGAGPNSLQIGRNGTIAGTYAKVDVAQVVWRAGILEFLPMNIVREINEHLIVKWNVI